jgi:putative tryptophan/tyrosine transport system substrate-binding protein
VERHRGDLVDLARPLGIEVHIFNVVRPEDFPAVFLEMVKKGDHGLIVQLSPFMGVHRRQIIELAARHRIAAMYGSRGSVEAGGLISYGANYADLARRTASFVDKVLKGAKPADLPIEQPTKFDLAINLKTAKALGLTIPPSLLLRADQVIE